MPEAASPPPAAQRLVSLDVFRGFVMFLMAAEMLEVPHVAAHFPDSWIWQTLKFHSDHVAWTGCSLHDLIQPAFSFMVGVALPFSVTSRLARGQSRLTMILHALWRALVLVLLGVFLRSIGKPMTYWTFEDTLSQIGFGYPFLFVLGFAGSKTRWAVLAAILIAYWMFFALYPVPSVPVDVASANIPSGWSHDFPGFDAHWNINRNAAWAFDRWFLNLFPRPEHGEFLGNKGGYSTLSFIPTLGTMILGLIAGQWLRDGNAEPAGGNRSSVIKRLVFTGAVCLALGWLLDVTGICPSVKKIWTPAWTLFSGGWCFLLMALFYLVLDVQGWRRWAFPLVVIGMNSIAMYVMVHTISGFIGDALHTHLGLEPFQKLALRLDNDATVFEPMLFGATILLILWLILLWMHRRKIYLRI